MTRLTSIDSRNRERLLRVAGILKSWRDRVRYVDYRQAERDVERLACYLSDQLSPEEIASATFRAVPRGGLIVLGMLSYALALKPAQLAPREKPRGLEIIVDDCSLTGARFRQSLSLSQGCQVAFLHLYSHPDLRRRIAESEPRVRVCLAAHDLEDILETRMNAAAERAAWRESWSERVGLDAYWIGQLEPVCFAWSEPDHPFWNRETGKIEEGWNFLPPHLCSKNRYELAPAVLHGRSEWRAPVDLAYGTFDGKLWLINLSTDQVASLEGAGADLWRWWAALGTRDAVATLLACAYNIEPDRAADEAVAFARVLADAGFLERRADDVRA